MSAYENLLSLSRELTLLRSTASLLGWDQETNLPPKGVAFRAEQLGYLSGRVHEMFTAPHVGDWISHCEDNSSGDAANLREWRWEYDRSTKLPTEFVEEFEKTRAHSMEAWQKARAGSDFGQFQPHLEKIVELSRRKADYIGYETCPYDALIDAWERGMTSARLREIFDALKSEIAEIGPAAWEKSASIPENSLNGDYPVGAQQAFNRKVAEAFGFDFEAGRIDTTTHPFCSGMAPGDTRLTTRYDASDFTSSLYGVMHETGHGLYEQGLPKDVTGAPVTESSSLGIHESQSRLWENHVGRSAAFWEHWYGTAVEHLPSLKNHTVEDVIRAVQRSAKSFIRVEADEVTYDLHVLLRFDLESRLMSGDLEVRDVPGAWNHAFEEMFGLKVENDRDGCLQDIHWSMGTLGYFPTYSLGNLNASHLFHHAKIQKPEIEGELARGEYGTLLAWLREHIHQRGRQELPEALIEAATGEPLNAQYHVNHLRERYASRN